MLLLIGTVNECELVAVYAELHNCVIVGCSGCSSSYVFLSYSLAQPAVTVSTVQPTSGYPNGTNISLHCSWNTSVYYVAWYKNGVLIYDKDLAASSVLMGPPQGISVDSNFTMMMSTLTIESAALDDSGNYTCAVTCGAKGVELDMIAGNLQNTAEVFVYGEWCSVK